jgi:hypothetical protein
MIKRKRIKRSVRIWEEDLKIAQQQMEQRGPGVTVSDVINEWISAGADPFRGKKESRKKLVQS